MKIKLTKIAATLTLLCVAAFAQSKDFYVPYSESSSEPPKPYQKEMRGIYIKFLKSLKNPADVVKVMDLEGMDFTKLENSALGLAAATKIVGNQISRMSLAERVNHQADERAVNALEVEYKKHREKYKSEFQEIESLKERFNTALYKHLQNAASALSLMSKNKSNPKGEFETSEQYNQRLKEDERLFKESTEARFLETITPIVTYIRKSIDAFPLILDKYNADNGIYTVASDAKWANKQSGQFKVSTEEAIQLKNAKDLKIYINPSDVYSVDYNLYVTKAEISLGDKKYTAEFPKAKNAQDIVFRGSELWKENLAAKNTAFTFAEVRKKQEEKKAALSGVLEDERDGKKYKTIKIDSQTWMAENLNYDADGSKCYDNKPANCDKYGRLYEWKTAKKACPAGWHLPDTTEWNVLMAAVGGKEIGGKNLKATSGWNRYDNRDGNGDDNYWFSALPGGGAGTGKFEDVGNYGYWWSASEYGSRSAYYLNISLHDAADLSIHSGPYSVRCVQNSEEYKRIEEERERAKVAASGSFVDSRDKKTYKTVKIGTQTWMAENLNYDASYSKCYNNDPANCQKYGRLYVWEIAKKACPADWHLPDTTEWNVLVATVGGEKTAGKYLKATSDWGKDDSGEDKYWFSALPGGNYDGSFSSVGKYGYWWSASELRSMGSAHIRYMHSGSIGSDEYYRQDIVNRGSGDKKEGNSVRCVQNSAAKAADVPTAAAATNVPAADKAAKKAMQEPASVAKAEAAAVPVAPAPKTEATDMPAAKELAKEETAEEGNEERIASPKENENKKEEKKEDKQEREIKWNLRIAYNASTVFFEGANSELGSGFEAGINANIPIQNTSFVFSIGANAIYRKPDNNEEYIDEEELNVRSELTEYVFSVPVMLQYNINSFYLQAGAQIDFPLKTEQTITIGEEVTWHECPWRNSYDLGLVLGLGWRINENFAIDSRMIVGVSEFDKEFGGYKLVQGSAGLSYFF